MRWPAPCFTALTLLTGLITGCGVSYDVRVHNATLDPIEVALIDRFASDHSPWLESTVAAGGHFQYAMRDGWRSDGKHIHITATAPDLRDIPPLEVEFAIGERLWPRSTTVIVQLENDRLIAK